MSGIKSCSYAEQTNIISVLQGISNKGKCGMWRIYLILEKWTPQRVCGASPRLLWLAMDVEVLVARADQSKPGYSGRKGKQGARNSHLWVIWVEMSTFCWAWRGKEGLGQLVPIKLGSLRIPCMRIRAGRSPIQEARAPEPPMQNLPLPPATDAWDPQVSSRPRDSEVARRPGDAGPPFCPILQGP